MPAGRMASRASSPRAMFIWVLALIAGAGFSIAGTNRLAATVAAVRTGLAKRTPVVRMLSHLPDEVVVATNVVPDDGRPIPELVVGPFGVAVVHELGPRDAIRPVGSTLGACAPRRAGCRPNTRSIASTATRSGSATG